jgi:hypothetical protein
MNKLLFPPPFSRRVSDFHIGDGTNYIEFQSNGQIVLHGTARIKRNLWIGVAGVKVPTVKPATYVDHGINGAWEFSDAADDTVVANVLIPSDIDISVIPCVRIKWSSPTADPGDDSKRCVWQVEYLWISENEDTTAAAEASPTITTSASTVVNGLRSACIDLSAPSATDIGIIIRIKRLGADGADTLGDVAHGLGFSVIYTSNKLGEAI